MEWVTKLKSFYNLFCTFKHLFNQLKVEEKLSILLKISKLMNGETGINIGLVKNVESCTCFSERKCFPTKLLTFSSLFTIPLSKHS